MHPKLADIYGQHLRELGFKGNIKRSTLYEVPHLEARIRQRAADPDAPIVGIDEITGLESSSAETARLVVHGRAADQINHDGTAITSAIVRVTLSMDHICGNADDLIDSASVAVRPNDDPSGETVYKDVTAHANANGGDFRVSFTAENQGYHNGFGTYTYCFEVVATDTAGRTSSFTGPKTLTWQGPIPKVVEKAFGNPPA